jgi:hypothetical protein
LYVALKKIESDPAGTQARAAAAQERAKEFSIDIAVGKLAELIRSV